MSSKAWILENLKNPLVWSFIGLENTIICIFVVYFIRGLPNFFTNSNSIFYFTMTKRFFILVLSLFIGLSTFAQEISDSKRKEIISEIQSQINTMSGFSAENLEMIPVYSSQISNANELIEKYKKYNGDNQIYRKSYELSSLIKQNQEMIDFLIPRLGDWFYKKAIASLAKDDKKKAYELLNKALDFEPNNVLINYELAKISLDSGDISSTTKRLSLILEKMNPDEMERELCNKLLTYTYDRNLAKALSLINQGKFAYANDILVSLEDYCKKDKINICNNSVVSSMLASCHKGIYNDHIKVTQKAVNMGKTDVAGDFVQNTYDYFQRNRENIKDTSTFNSIVMDIVKTYINDAKKLSSAKDYQNQLEKIEKAKSLAMLIGGEFEANALRDMAQIQGGRTPVDMKLDSIEALAPNESIAEKFPQYIKDSVSTPEEDSQKIKEIEKDYIISSENKLPQKSLAVEQTKTKSLKKEIEDKFFESRTFMRVSNFEAALEVLEKANRLAKIDLEKEEVEKMYTSAIREITARRMSKAEYYIFEGDVVKSDSLVNKTNDLITAYKMDKDPEIIRIMDSYLRAIDKKVCQKKQDEIDVFAYNIIDCIRKNDFYKADDLIVKAMMVKGSYECRLDKHRIRQLKVQIEKPIEYLELKESCLKALEVKDTLKFIKEYAALEEFYTNYQLNELSVVHIDLK
ncbi:MAG: hypothetical protein ACK5MH_01990, partial [Bacteroidales bacterium]